MAKQVHEIQCATGAWAQLVTAETNIVINFANASGRLYLGAIAPTVEASFPVQQGQIYADAANDAGIWFKQDSGLTKLVYVIK